MEPMLHADPTVNHGHLAEGARFILYRGRAQEGGQGQEEGHGIVPCSIEYVAWIVMSCHVA